MNIIHMYFIYHSLTHRAGPFLGIRQFCSYSRNSQHFMEPEDSLPCSQEASRGPYPEPDQSNPYHNILSLTYALVFPVDLSFRLSNQYPICISPLPHSCYIPYHFILLDLIILITLGEEYKLWSSSLCSFLQPPVTSSLFGPNIPLNTLLCTLYIIYLILWWIGQTLGLRTSR
jgi:hypothetical protein